MHAENDPTAASTTAASPESGTPEGPFVKPKFGGVLLVCSDCEKRSSGPTKHTAKEWRGELKKALGNQPLRWRVVGCSCLGLCPRKATAIAAAAADIPVKLAAVRRKGDLRAFADGLMKRG
jgi:hypothetical protein